MAQNLSKLKKSVSVFTLLLLLFAASSIFTGCSSDDDDEDAYKNKIQVCNEDNEDYRVKLCRESDGVVIREFNLVSVYDITDLSKEKCDYFENIDKGSYYITIHEDNSSSESHRSEPFYMDNGAMRYFRIDNVGKIHSVILI